MRGSLLDSVFQDITERHKDHPDVSALPTAELLRTLRAAQAELTIVKKDTHMWVPPVSVLPEVEKFQIAQTKFISVCIQVSGYVRQFSSLVSPDKKEVDAQKRHWRAERTKLADAYKEHRKLPDAVAKTLADAIYDQIAPTSRVDINLGYTASYWTSKDLPFYDVPFIVEAQQNFEGDATPVHKACWSALSTILPSAEYKSSVEQIVQGMTGSKVRVARQAMAMNSVFEFWPQGNGRVPPVSELKTCVTIMSTEYFDSSVRTSPFRLVAGMYQITSGQFVVMCLAPEISLQHSNIAQFITAGESTLFYKTFSFYAGAGMSFFVPFGWTALMVASSDEFTATYLGSDPKKKDLWKKVPKCCEYTGKFVFHPLFDRVADLQQSPEMRTLAGYLWSKSSVYLPKSWLNSNDVKSYWSDVTADGSGEIVEDAGAGGEKKEA